MHVPEAPQPFKTEPVKAAKPHRDARYLTPGVVPSQTKGMKPRGGPVRGHTTPGGCNSPREEDERGVTGTSSAGERWGLPQPLTGGR